jgi:hypothetical protein
MHTSLAALTRHAMKQVACVGLHADDVAVHTLQMNLTQPSSMIVIACQTVLLPRIRDTLSMHQLGLAARASTL